MGVRLHSSFIVVGALLCTGKCSTSAVQVTGAQAGGALARQAAGTQEVQSNTQMAKRAASRHVLQAQGCPGSVEQPDPLSQEATRKLMRAMLQGSLSQ